MTEKCHRNPEKTCALDNIVSRMDCVICEEVAERIAAKLVRPKFAIGQKVKIKATGKEFIIDEIAEDRFPEVRYTAKDICNWYPASKLELVEEPLKIGDRVICDCGESVLFPEAKLDGKTGTVTDSEYITNEGIKCVAVNWDDGCKRNLVLASSLRKIPTQEPEIMPIDLNERLATVESNTFHLPSWKIETGARLSSIEKQLAEMREMHARTIHKLRKRIRDLETWQGEHDLEKQSRLRITARTPSLEEAKQMLTPIGRIAVFGSMGIDPCDMLRALQEHEAKWARKKTEESPVVAKILDEPEIKKGDFAEVSKASYNCTAQYIGKILKVLEVDRDAVLLEGGLFGIWHKMHSLRLLSDEEMARKLNERPT